MLIFRIKFSSFDKWMYQTKMHNLELCYQEATLKTNMVEPAWAV